MWDHKAFLHFFKVAKVYSMRAGKTQKFKFSPLDGQYVNVLLPGENHILTVCEVEVYAVSEGKSVTCNVWVFYSIV